MSRPGTSLVLGEQHLARCRGLIGGDPLQPWDGDGIEGLRFTADADELEASSGTYVPPDTKQPEAGERAAAWARICDESPALAAFLTDVRKAFGRCEMRVAINNEPVVDTLTAPIPRQRDDKEQ
ncbi:MAG: hypothetical protein ACYDHY_09655 [Acidiferrobacterales bacterium]